MPATSVISATASSAWENLRREHTLELRRRLQDSYAPATANKVLSALRGVLRAARRMNLMQEGEFQTAASLEPVNSAPPPSRVDVTHEAAAALFGACRGDDAASRRDAAMLAIFLSSGLRRSEAVALDVADYDPKAGRLRIRGEKPENDRLVTLRAECPAPTVRQPRRAPRWAKWSPGHTTKCERSPQDTPCG